MEYLRVARKIAKFMRFIEEKEDGRIIGRKKEGKHSRALKKGGLLETMKRIIWSSIRE